MSNNLSNGRATALRGTREGQIVFQKYKFPYRFAQFYRVNICGKSMCVFIKLVEEEGRNRRERIA